MCSRKKIDKACPAYQLIHKKSFLFRSAAIKVWKNFARTFLALEVEKLAK